MVIKFIALELANLDPNLNPMGIHRACLAQIQFHGTPLRWAITQVDGGTAKIEAIVTY
ncbi:MAG: hypothetical protein SFT94_09225 [Pseudanabaenaceae cyanobacterium bins.68]|nr:hypothetical protein [Pseudanabaenaceae cyanobacterium bins.68]